VIESTDSRPRAGDARERGEGGLVTFVETPGEKFLFASGERFVWDSLPVGTRIVNPRPPLPAIADPDAAIERALDHPLGCEPLSAKLRPGMKVTIAFDDISLPLPPMVKPDVRRRVIAILLRRLAAAGVTDIHLIVAVSLHRHMTEAELRDVLGDEIVGAFWPDRLYNHDAEDPDGNVFLGETEQGEVVEISARAATSDLLIYVNINLVSMDGGHKSVPIGLATYRSVRAHHNVHTMMHSRSYMDPRQSALHASCERMGKVVAEHVDLFTIETTLNTRMFPPSLSFMNKRERDYGLADRASLLATRKLLDAMPLSVNRRIFGTIRSPYGLTGVHAGRTGPVHEKTLENVFAQQLVPVEGQADILIYGLAHVCPYNVNSIMNPILVMCLGLGYMFNFYRGKPLVRKGGAMIFLHPVEAAFHKTHHPSYIDFFENVLTQTTDSSEIEKRFEASFAHDERYRELYRRRNAFHGVHPFYMWYWGTYGMRHVAKTIFVNPVSREAVRRMGFECASSLSEAIEMATSAVGPSPQITWHRVPPISMVEVL
jgi:hypothetical protein